MREYYRGHIGRANRPAERFGLFPKKRLKLGGNLFRFLSVSLSVGRQMESSLIYSTLHHPK